VRILLHCVYYPPEVGGLESHVGELARGLASKGHEVRVVTSRSMKGLPTSEMRNGVRVHRSPLPSRTPWGWILHSLGSLPVTARWARWADVLHAQAFASIVPCGLASRLAGKPLVATLHTSHFLMRAERPGWRRVLARLIRRPRHVLAASQEIAQVAMGLAPGVEVEALTNGVDTERFCPVEPTLRSDGGTRRILVPRRLFHKNGVEYFVRAMPSIVARLPNAEALLIGDGPERQKLESLARDLGVEEVVHFLGGRAHEEMPGLLASGELAVFPSLMEATSVAALECMSCQLPVVASRVGGLPEIIDDSVGALVPPGDPAALADAVVTLLESPSREDMGRRARERVVAEWSNDRLVLRHLEIYRSLAGGETGDERNANLITGHR
jgi:glycosyltransferase involved in cell wall biosynthesis